jgi:hypothetical protein
MSADAAPDPSEVRVPEPSERVPLGQLRMTIKKGRAPDGSGMVVLAFETFYGTSIIDLPADSARGLGQAIIEAATGIAVAGSVPHPLLGGN